MPSWDCHIQKRHMLSIHMSCGIQASEHVLLPDSKLVPPEEDNKACHMGKECNSLGDRIGDIEHKQGSVDLEYREDPENP